MKNGEGCVSLCFLQIANVHDSGVGKKKYRVCNRRMGIFLKQWRCVGKDSPECPGFVPRMSQRVKITETKGGESDG